MSTNHARTNLPFLSGGVKGTDVAKGLGARVGCGFGSCMVRYTASGVGTDVGFSVDAYDGSPVRACVGLSVGWGLDWGAVDKVGEAIDCCVTNITG